MRAQRSCHSLPGILALVGLPGLASAHPVGSEFQVNTYTTNSQLTVSRGNHLIAADANGNFVVVWWSNVQDGDNHGVFGQRYDNEGVAQGSEFRVNTFTGGDQVYPSVASTAEGGFVVVWESGAQQDGSGTGIFGQRYDNAGNSLGVEFRVNSYTFLEQQTPSAASDASGNFVVVWRDYLGRNGIFGQRFDSDGVPRGGEFQVNTYTTPTCAPNTCPKSPSIASDASGNFVVVWASSGQDGSGLGVFGQRYDSEGVALGSEFQVNSFTPGNQVYPSVACDAAGNFLVVWFGGGQDDSLGVFGQRYDSAGGAQGGEILVNTHTTSAQIAPNVSSDASGNFVVVWQSHDDQDGESTGVFGQRYDTAGRPQGNEFQVNSFTTGGQSSPAVGATGLNQFVAVWQSYPQDGSWSGVFGQRFDFASVTVESPDTNVKWRIGSHQRIKWTHNLGADARFRIELDRNDDGGYEELIAAHADVDSATRGHFAWTVTGPPSATARVRISWTDNLAVSDTSDVTFQITRAEPDDLARGSGASGELRCSRAERAQRLRAGGRPRARSCRAEAAPRESTPATP